MEQNDVNPAASAEEDFTLKTSFGTIFDAKSHKIETVFFCQQKFKHLNRLNWNQC